MSGVVISSAMEALFTFLKAQEVGGFLNVVGQNAPYSLG